MTEEVKNKLISRVRRNPYVNHLKIDFVKVDDGFIEARMPLSAEQKQYSGVIHGGILASLADTIAGFAAYTLTPPHMDVLTAQLNMNYLRAAWGDELAAIGKVIKPGRIIHYSECEIYCDGKLICKAQGNFCVVGSQTD